MHHHPPLQRAEPPFDHRQPEFSPCLLFLRDKFMATTSALESNTACLLLAGCQQQGAHKPAPCHEPRPPIGHGRDPRSICPSIIPQSGTLLSFFLSPSVFLISFFALLLSSASPIAARVAVVSPLDANPPGKHPPFPLGKECWQPSLSPSLWTAGFCTPHHTGRAPFCYDGVDGTQKATRSPLQRARRSGRIFFFSLSIALSGLTLRRGREGNGERWESSRACTTSLDPLNHREAAALERDRHGGKGKGEGGRGVSMERAAEVERHSSPLPLALRWSRSAHRRNG